MQPIYSTIHVLLASLPTSDNVFMAFETLVYIDEWLDIEMSYIKRSCTIPFFLRLSASYGFDARTYKLNPIKPMARNTHKSATGNTW